MLARRNLAFWTAALLTAASYPIVTAKYLVEAVHLYSVHGFADDKIAIVLNLVACPLGAAGWVLVATAFQPRIDWPRLRLGATIVVAVIVTTYAATVFRVLATNTFEGSGSFRGYFIWSAIDAFLIAGAGLIVASGLGRSKRGAPRATRLRIGIGTSAAGFAAATVAVLCLQSYWSSHGFTHEATIGALAQAVGQGGLALAALAFAAGEDRSLRAREARLSAAAAGATAATACMAVGTLSIAIGYSTHGAPAWLASLYWLDLACDVTTVAAFAFVAVGARSVRGALAARDALA